MTPRHHRVDNLVALGLECPAHNSAAGYTMRFPAEVKDGVIHGQHGVSGQPTSLTLTGKIATDGNASLAARGITGDPRFTINRESTGTPYGWRASARLEGSRGSGSKTEIRPCNLTFVK